MESKCQHGKDFFTDGVCEECIEIGINSSPGLSGEEIHSAISLAEKDNAFRKEQIPKMLKALDDLIRDYQEFFSEKDLEKLVTVFNDQAKIAGYPKYSDYKIMQLLATLGANMIIEEQGL